MCFPSNPNMVIPTSAGPHTVGDIALNAVYPQFSPAQQASAVANGFVPFGGNSPPPGASGGTALGSSPRRAPPPASGVPPAAFGGTVLGG